MPGLGLGAPKPLSRRVFDKYDTDGSGAIGALELQHLVREVGSYEMDALELALAVAILDADGSGQIEYGEFKAWWADEDRFKQLQLTQDEQAKLHAAVATFQRFDADGGGVLDRAEFAGLHAELTDQGLTNQPMSQCLAEMDADGGGEIEFHEFVGWQLSHAVVGSALESMIRRYADADRNGEVTQAEYETARRRTLLAISSALGFSPEADAEEGWGDDGQWQKVEAGFTAVLEQADECQKAEFEQAVRDSGCRAPRRPTHHSTNSATVWYSW